jgi:HEAT repeat protein
VASLAELKVPSALLEMARRRPDVPANLISKALGSCSVDSLDFLASKVSEPSIGDVGFEGFGSDITTLEPAGSVEDLPADSDDDGIRQALLAIQSEHASERVEGAKELAKYQVQASVDGLMTLARVDDDASVRSQAISSLSLINHESVFPAVLIGMADESREVRAAAARSLSHLSFARTDAYIRVLETNDQALLEEVARACIKAGIVSQAIDRLATSDRRQAYETFSIFSLLARAKQSQPVLDAIINHSKLRVRLASLRLLTNTGEPEVFEQLRENAGRDDLAEGLRTALLEAMYKLDQSSAKSKIELPAEPLSSTNDLVFKINSALGEEVDVASTQSPDPQS